MSNDSWVKEPKTGTNREGDREISRYLKTYTTPDMFDMVSVCVSVPLPEFLGGKW